MVEIEREFTFLVNQLPANLADFPSIIIADNYLPADSDHPVLRLRRRGDQYEITKKYPTDSTDGGQSGDSSRQVEHTIPLDAPEYQALATIPGKSFVKRRFFYEHEGQKCDLDVYLTALSGLVVVDFEFADDESMQNFQKPDWVGADVTQELMIAGGILAGKSYSDLAKHLQEQYNYQPVKNTKQWEEK
ncbi:hypothetical protein FWH13_03525 [Candidatus Saccharibacteria bacterium]|nr:hypothetical protein [Candidatus Saccharibacteria bacterium]